jgi:hypothetical protein
MPIYSYDSGGTRRQLQGIYAYDSGGTRRTIQVGYAYDSSGNRQEFYRNLSSSLPASISVLDLVIDPADASAYIEVYSNGTYYTSGVGAGTSTWMGGGTGADYEARWTPDPLTGSTYVALTSSSGTGSWLSLGTSRIWQLDNTSVDSRVARGTLEVRMAAAPNTVLSTTVVTLTATVEN